jgi:hypothetical protein
MPSNDPAHLIDHARHCVRVALRQWKPTDLQRVHASRSLLEQSVSDLKTAIELLRGGTATVTTEYQPIILNLRQDITSMIRLVDACTAFHRGISLRRGTDPSYDASGQTIKDPDAVPVDGVIG